METVKKFLFAIILLGVIAFIWVGITFFYEGKDMSVPESTKAYTTQISKSFNLKELDKVYERTEQSFPVSPREFLNLVERNN